jgi:hypothetical protein
LGSTLLEVMQTDNLDPIEAVADRVKYCIENNLGNELLNTLSAAETYLSDRKELLFDAFFNAGEFRLKELDYDNSIQYFNKSRKYNPAIIKVFDKIIESTNALYTANKEKFIKSDLLKLLPPIKMLIDYYGNLLSDKQLSNAEDFISRLAYRINFIAPEAVEGKMTHRVNVIVNALEKEVPMEQVRKEVAKFIADLLKKEQKKKLLQKKQE